MKTSIKRSLLAILALAILAFAAGCGSSDAPKQDPAEAMKSALEKTSTIKSGNAEVKGSISIGSLPGSLAVTGGGPFDTEAKGGGAVELSLSVDIAGTAQEFGLVAVDGKNYLTVGDKALEQKESDGGLEPGQIADFISGLGDNLTNVKSPSANTYTATVDVKKLLAEGDADISKLSFPGLGSGAQLAKSLSTATIKVTVDADGYAQTMDIDLPLSQGGNQGGVRATITLTEINQPQTIEAPKNVVTSPAELGGLGAAFAGQ
jgi:hypothetical protein